MAYPEAVQQFFSSTPPQNPAGTPEAPYGMGDCRTFLNVPPLVHWEDGTTCINPDFEAVKKYALSAKGRDITLPSDRSLVPSVVVPVGGDPVTMQLTVEREENGMGHFLVEELLMLTDPADRMDGVLVEIKTLQGDQVYTNAPAPALNVFGNAHLNCCLPCPILLYPNQTLVFTLTNFAIPAVDIRVRIVARGKRFLPYHNPSLIQEMERCWSMNQSSPFWLSFDNRDLRIAGAAGAVPATARGQMSIPGGGFFELTSSRVQVIADVPGLVDADDMLIQVTDGRIGRRLMDGPIRLGAHFATPTATVVGFPGDTFRAASACHCPPPTQMFKGNTRLIHDLSNESAVGAFVRITHAGCMHYADACPPQVDLDLVRRYGSGDANALRRAQEKGDRVYLSFFDDNPLYADEVTECQAPAASRSCEAPSYEEPYYEPAPAPAPPPPPTPEPPRIESMWRPSKAYFGPGSTGALPYNLSFGRDQYGQVHVVVRDPKNNTFVRFTAPHEAPQWTPSYLKSMSQPGRVSGMGSLGGDGRRGEWERI